MANILIFASAKSFACDWLVYLNTGLLLYCFCGCLSPFRTLSHVNCRRRSSSYASSAIIEPLVDTSIDTLPQPIDKKTSLFFYQQLLLRNECFARCIFAIIMQILSFLGIFRIFLYIGCI